MTRLLWLALTIALALAPHHLAQAQFGEDPAAFQDSKKPRTQDASAAKLERKLAPEFPSAREQWLHGQPLSLDALKGKAALLWFFEESCPRCRETWPKLVATAKQFEGQPIIFIGVNSGSDPGTIDQYLRDTSVPWPILLDPARTYEQQCGVTPISLQNIYQVRLITPDGRMIDGAWNDIEGSVKKALEGAAWKVDPTDIPPSLRIAWQAVELNNFTMAGPTIKRNLTSTKPDVKQAAVKLRDAVQVVMNKDVAEAKAAEQQGNLWEAYERYAEATERFKGFDLPAEVAAASKKLLENPDVKANQAAQRELKLAERALASDTPTGRIRAQTILQKIVATMPTTEAAKEAESLLAQLRRGEL